MTDDITRQPLAHAVLAALATNRSKDDPLGELARSVLRGEADLRTAAAASWHAQALDKAFTEALARRDQLTPEQRAGFEQQADLLREAGEQLSVESDDDGPQERR